MTEITQAAGHVIAGDITNVFHAADAMLLSSARLTASVLEGTEKSGLHPRRKQALLDSMASGYGAFLKGRKDMVLAHRQMLGIKDDSNLEPMSFGCWESGPLPGGLFAQSDDRPVAETRVDAV